MKACIKISSFSLPFLLDIGRFVITQWVASPGTQNLLAVICCVVLVAASGFQIYIFTYRSLSSTFIIPLHRQCKNLTVVYYFLALGFFAIIIIGLITYLNISFTLHLMDIWASLVAQMVKNSPAMQEPGFNPWVGKIPWREGIATHSSILAWRIPMDRGVLFGYYEYFCKEQSCVSLSVDIMFSFLLGSYLLVEFCQNVW